jgi:uncharacterized membrane protein YvbJ
MQGEVLSMPVCPYCDAAVPEGAVNCGNCGAVINPQTSISSSQPHGDMNERLRKVLRRTELLSYAAAGLGVAILVFIIALSFL